MDILIIIILRYNLKIKNGVGFYGIEVDSILRNNLIPWKKQNNWNSKAIRIEWIKDTRL